MYTFHILNIFTNIKFKYNLFEVSVKKESKNKNRFIFFDVIYFIENTSIVMPIYNG